MEEKMSIVSISLPNSETLNNLKEYNLFVKTIFVQKLKSLSTFGGYTNVVCANALKQIDLTDEICKLINSVVIKLPGFSVYSGIVISSLILDLWSEPIFEYGAHNISKALMEFQNILESCIEQMKVESEAVDVNFLQMLILPSLLEEPAIYLDKDALYDLSLQVVKAVLLVANSDLRLGHITVHVEQGENDFFVVNGVVCEVDDICLRQVQSGSLCQSVTSKTVLFSECLEDVQNLPLFIEEIGQNDGVLVVCQKRVSDTTKLMLRRARISVIERVGEDTFKALEQLTGAVPVRDLGKSAISNLVAAMGNFSDIKPVKKSRKNLVYIVNCESSVATIFIQCRTFADSSLIKEVVKSAVSLVRSALSSPYYLPGPTSFEASLSSHLKAKIRMTSLLDKIIGIFIKTLDEISTLYSQSLLQGVSLDSYSLKRNAILHSLNTVMNVLSLGRIVRST